MPEAIELLIHFFVSAIKLLKPGGVKVVMAETIAMKQQLIVMNRGNKRSPVLTTPDRFLFGILAHFVNGNRLKKIAVIIKPNTLLAFHKSLVNRKYSRLYSNKAKRNPGRKPQDQAIIDLVIEMKKRNPSFGYGPHEDASGLGEASDRQEHRREAHGHRRRILQARRREPRLVSASRAA